MNMVNMPLKYHLKTIKKKNGCNGTIKEIPDETNSNLIKILQKAGRVVSNSDFTFLAQKHAVPSFSTSGKPLSESDIKISLLKA